MDDSIMDLDPSHPSDAEIERFHRQQMDAVTLVVFTDHLADCEACRTRASRLAAGPGNLLDGLDDLVDHLSEDDLHALIDESIAPERARVLVRHASRCQMCAAEVQNLREFAAGLRQRRSTRNLWYSAAAIAATLLLAVGAIVVRRNAADRSILSLHDAESTVAVDDRGVLTGAGALAASDQAVVVQALSTGALVIAPSIQTLTGTAGPLMGGRTAPPFDVISPLATVVLDTAPTFRWTSAPDATGYTVTIRDQSDGTIMTSPALTATEWAPDRPLARGRTFSWQVAARIGGREVVAPAPSQPLATFHTADQSTADGLRRLPSSHVVRAVLYARAGLLDDAERELASLSTLNPRATVIERWRAQLKAARSPAPPR